MARYQQRQPPPDLHQRRVDLHHPSARPTTVGELGSTNRNPTRTTARPTVLSAKSDWPHQTGDLSHPATPPAPPDTGVSSTNQLRRTTNHSTFHAGEPTILTRQATRTKRQPTVLTGQRTVIIGDATVLIGERTVHTRHPTVLICEATLHAGEGVLRNAQETFPIEQPDLPQSPLGLPRSTPSRAPPDTLQAPPAPQPSTVATRPSHRTNAPSPPHSRLSPRDDLSSTTGHPAFLTEHADPHHSPSSVHRRRP